MVPKKRKTQVKSLNEKERKFSRKSEKIFIKGGNSNYVLEKDKPMILKHFPNAKFETIPNVGHWLHAENPKLFFEITNNFLKND